MADGVGACTFRCRLGALTFWFKAGQHGPLNSRGAQLRASARGLAPRVMPQFEDDFPIPGRPARRDGT
jgi:hypothetical protein